MELKLDIPEHQLFPKPKKPRRRRRTKAEMQEHRIMDIISATVEDMFGN